MNRFIFLFTCFISTIALAQDAETEAYYYQIPDYPEAYTAGSAIARMVDGLGFRYYWATEDLRDQDLNYKPTDSSRTTLETINHIYGLSNVVLNAAKKTITDFTVERRKLSYPEIRTATLENIKQASEILKLASPNDIEEFMIIFKNKRGLTEYPFWNNINGPIADAIWHTGQVVLLRRASGNPFNSKVSVLRGRVRE